MRRREFIRNSSLAGLDLLASRIGRLAGGLGLLARGRLTPGLLAPGLALVSPGCERSRTIPGEIVGASAAIGHLLRDKGGEGLGEPVDRVEKEVVIVGGGISGLSAARWLRRHGVKDLAILDLEKNMGGNAACGSNEVSAYPWGAHYVPVPNNELTEYLAFMEEAGVITGRDEQGLPVYNEYVLCCDPQERLYLNGHWQDGLIPRSGIPAEGQEELARFLRKMEQYRQAKGSDGVAAFAIPVDRSSKDPVYTVLDTMTMDDWLRREGYRSAALYWYVNYCTRDDFGTAAAAISAWTGIHYFAARRGRAANARHYDVLTWPQGNGWLVEQLSKDIGDCRMNNALVVKVRPVVLPVGEPVVRSVAPPNQAGGGTSGGGAAALQSGIQGAGKQSSGAAGLGVEDPKASGSGVEIQYYDVTAKVVRSIVARHCILAVPQFVANRLLPVNEGRIKTVESQLRYVPWMVANLTVSRMEERSGQPMSWDNVLYDSNSLGYVEATHQQLQQIKEKKVLTYYLPLTGTDVVTERKKARERSHADWVRMIIEDLRRVHPDIEAKTERIDIMVWGHAMAQPRPGWIHGGVRRELQQSLGARIHFAHTDLAGISIFEEGFYQGIGAAEKVLAARGATSGAASGG